MTAPLYFEDFDIGRQFHTGRFTIGMAQAVEFAREYDPQYFHIDEQAAFESPFGRLAVSGWQTAAISMKLKAGTPLVNVAGGLVGLGLESLRWPKPVYPGDTLRVIITITNKRRSQSKPGHGIVNYKMETFNQQDELVMETATAVIMPVRAGA